jgi:serine protease AprX
VNQKRKKYSPQGILHPIYLYLLTAIILFSFLAPAGTVALAEGNPNEPRAHPKLLEYAQQHPNERIRVIVQRRKLENMPERALERLGARRAKTLRMIDGIVMELPGRLLDILARSRGVRWVSIDAPLVSSSFETLNARDEFTAGDYSGSDGNLNWSSNWTELTETNGPASGYVRAGANSNCPSGNCLYFNRYGISRQINLKRMTAATLTFDYRRYVSSSSSATISCQVSTDNGATWTTLTSYSLYYSDSEPHTEQLDLTPYITQQTLIRFRSSAYFGGGFYLDNVQVSADRPISEFTQAVGANFVKDYFGYDGSGVTVAVVDSGIANHPDFQSSYGSRLAASVAFGNHPNSGDDNGHGTHVAGIIAGNGNQSNGVRAGVAPGVNLINVKVSNQDGASYTSDLIDSLQWIYDNRNTYNIRVVNLSLNSTVPESYLSSPIDAAVEILWFNGIVVVVSAGNNGDNFQPVNLYPPANDPFVITVGSTEDQGTVDTWDDLMADFSAFGLTEDGYQKPEIVTPGRNLISALASQNASLYNNHPQHRVDSDYFRLSGTSMSAPVVSGAVALLLQAEPYLTPDQVKYRLMASANTWWSGYTSQMAGAGMLDVYSAIIWYTYESANQGIPASQLLWTGENAVVWDSVAWNSVAWNSVAWNSVAWNSVAWNSVAWNSVAWNSAVWDD